jgi:glucose/arabinose dehydrogenase
VVAGGSATRQDGAMTHRLPSPAGRSVRLRAPIAVSAALAFAALLAPATSASVTSVRLTDGGVTEAAPGPATIRLTHIVDLAQPVFATGARDGSNRLFIVTKGGRIRIVKNGALLPTPFLDISGSVSGGSEQGLLGLAFSPQFKTNRKFYINYTNTQGNTVIKQYLAGLANPDVAIASTGKTILTIAQPYANHNGGMLAFGKDGYLYIGMGDGGSAGDPGNRAQDVTQLLGKMLRINVNGATRTRNYLIPKSNPYVGKPGRDEIWQRGLRNPWRFSFDRSTGNLWIGDVGQARYEEVDRAIRTSAGPGRGINWGWHVMEGRQCYLPATGCNKTGKTLPLTVYSHATNGRCAIVGGYVYRGTAIPALAGWYVYGDYCSGEVWALNSTAAAPATGVQLIGPGTGRLISGFGEGDNNALYLCDLNGAVYRIDHG